MFTNAYAPMIGGVERSVQTFSEGLRRKGHEVLVVAPEFPGATADDDNVYRVPSLERIAGTGFSLPLPASRALDKRLRAFGPELVHSHHPFLLGDTALRVAAAGQLPILFTYHTRYELYDDLPDAKKVVGYQRLVLRIAQSLALGYCDLCDAIVAPSQSTASFLTGNGIATPVTVIPTGIDTKALHSGDGKGMRASLRIPAGAFVLGHVGRMAPEKNLSFLVEAAIDFLRRREDAFLLLVGDGMMRNEIKTKFERSGVGQRVRMPGVLLGQPLTDAYHAMDVFAFGSKSETQGLVLAEALAAGLPVIALSAPGAAEILRDGENGVLLSSEVTARDFSAALVRLTALAPTARTSMRNAARKSAQALSRDICVKRLSELYAVLREGTSSVRDRDAAFWRRSVRRFSKDLKIAAHQVSALGRAIFPYGGNWQTGSIKAKRPRRTSLERT